MKSIFRITLAGAIALISLGTVFASGAKADCGFAGKPKVAPASFSMPWTSQSEAPIVGLWSFKMVAKDSPGIPDGTPIDAGFAQWHGDGTEIMNSSRPPATSNFCLGTWEQVGHRTYKLNHFAISSNLDGTPIGPARIREEVTLDDDADRFTGNFSIDQYDKTGKLLMHVQGEISAKRIKVTTPIQDVL